MIEQILQNELQANSLQIADIVSYLNNNGWQAVSHPNPHLLVFQGETDDIGNPIQLVLPSQNTFEDSPRLIAKVINLLAVVQAKSPPEIIKLITQTRTTSVTG
ncbi:hypothetical protein CAL7716_007880 [Calothrix sp. PCC 7716]|nr:hypothetical protein CAL7716_007880 [Calothrix sp. PCC 7716]